MKITAFLKTLFAYPESESARVEIRTFAPNDRPGPRRWYPLNDAGFAQAEDDAAKWRHAHNVYFGVLPREDGGGELIHLRSAAVLWCDIDAGNQTRAEATELLKAAITKPGADGRTMPVPHVIIGSGGGLHVYWKLAHPYPCELDSEQKRLRHLCRDLVRFIGGDPTGAHACPKATDPARILRLPDTLNHKTDPPRPTGIIRLVGDAPRWTMREWEDLLPPEPLPPPRPKSRSGGDYQGFGKSSDCGAIGRGEIPRTVAQLMVSGSPPGHRHGDIMKSAAACFKRNLPEETVLTVCEQIAAASGSCAASDQRKIADIVHWAAAKVLPDPAYL